MRHSGRIHTVNETNEVGQIVTVYRVRNDVDGRDITLEPGNRTVTLEAQANMRIFIAEPNTYEMGGACVARPTLVELSPGKPLKFTICTSVQRPTELLFDVYIEVEGVWHKARRAVQAEETLVEKLWSCVPQRFVDQISEEERSQIGRCWWALIADSRPRIIVE